MRVLRRFFKKSDVVVKNTVKVSHTAYPDVILNPNQHRGYLNLIVHKDISRFNDFASKNLSDMEKSDLLNHIKLNDLYFS